MRNYLDLFDIHRDTDPADIVSQLEATQAEVDADYGADLMSVLASSTRYTHYKRLHLQYEAMATALATGLPQQDSNSWSKRLVEFEPTSRDLPD